MYEKIGGQASVVALIDKLYDKILANPVTAVQFVGKDVNHTKKHQVEFWGRAIGSGLPYTGRGMIAIHTGLHITKEQFDIVAGYVLDSLHELSVDEESIEVIMKFASSMEPKIINL